MSGMQTAVDYEYDQFKQENKKGSVVTGFLLKNSVNSRVTSTSKPFSKTNHVDFTDFRKI